MPATAVPSDVVQATLVAVAAGAERLSVSVTAVVPDAPSRLAASAPETPVAGKAGSFVRMRKLSNEVVPPCERMPEAPSTTDALNEKLSASEPPTVTLTDVPLSTTTTA